MRKSEHALQDAARQKLREEKIAREKVAKEKEEEESRKEKSRLNQRLMNIKRECEELGISFEEKDSCFFFYRYFSLYSEISIKSAERKILELREVNRKQDELQKVKSVFLPKFLVFLPRLQSISLDLSIGEEGVVFLNRGYPYSDEGVIYFVSSLVAKEKDLLDEKIKAQEKILYEKERQKAVELGLPSNIRIWCRRGGRTNAGDGWVIGKDGKERDCTSWYNPRPRHTGEGDKIWEQILEDELVLQWSKANSSAEHEFKVVFCPKNLTENQRERVFEIQKEIEENWKDARGLASGKKSPSVGQGWGL